MENLFQTLGEILRPTRPQAQEIEKDLLHANDGPVTKFVLINRALQLAANKNYPAYDIANVLYECLEGFEIIPSNEFSYSL